jgi:hypothetical protein
MQELAELSAETRDIPSAASIVAADAGVLFRKAQLFGYYVK